MNENNTIQLAAPRMATIEETAKLFNLPTYLVRTKAKSGEIVAISAGNKILINVDRFADYLNTHTLANDTDKLDVDEDDNPIKITPIAK